MGGAAAAMKIPYPYAHAYVYVCDYMHVILKKRKKKIDMADVLFNGRRLEELKVVEIRDELAKRNLPRKGIKSTLIKRFEKVLLKELQEQVCQV